jgi:hypothetical protein
LSAEDRRALTEILIDKIVIYPHPSKIDMDGTRHYLIRAIPYQDPEQEAERRPLDDGHRLPTHAEASLGVSRARLRWRGGH